MTERMSPYFAVFNGHVNDASDRADAEFKAQFGPEAFEKHIAPFHEQGIMAIFNSDPDIYTFAWVTLVTAYVNEKVTSDV